MAPQTWFIAPKLGEDVTEKNGIEWGHDAGRAFATHEFFKDVITSKYKDGIITDDVEVNLLNDFDGDTPVIIDFTLGRNASMTYRGVKPLTVLHEGTFTGVTSIDRQANQPQEVTDSSLVTKGLLSGEASAQRPWHVKGLVNSSGTSLRRICITKGWTAGAIAFPCKDLGGGTVRTSRFGRLGKVTGSRPPTQRRVQPVEDNDFVVESGFTRIDSFAVDVRISPIGTQVPPGKVHLLFIDLELNPSAQHNHQLRARAAPVGGGPATIVFTGCGLGHLTPQYANKVLFEFCRLDATHFQGTLVQLAGCCCLGEVVAFEGARVVAYADTIFQGHPLRVQGLARLGEVSFFDAGSAYPAVKPPPESAKLDVPDVAGLQVEQGGTARVEELLKGFGGGQAVYGKGNTGTGAKVRAGGCIVYDGDQDDAFAAGMTLTGGMGDVDVAGTVSAWSSVAPDLSVYNKHAAVVRND